MKNDDNAMHGKSALHFSIHSGLPRNILTLIMMGVAWYVVYSRIDEIGALLAFRLLRLSAASQAGEGAVYFFNTSGEVLWLLILVIYVMGIIRTFFQPEKVRRMLGDRRHPVDYLLAGLFGVVTPFCSCSAVPIFLGFVTSGVPLGMTFSFLIASPMVNEIAVSLLFVLFGLKIALTYVASGLAIAFLVGFLMDRFKMERYLEPWVREFERSAIDVEVPKMDFQSRMAKGADAVKEILRRIWPYALIGIGIAAVIHMLVPSGFFSVGFSGCPECSGNHAPHGILESTLPRLFGKRSWESVPLAVLLGAPMYSNPAGMLPILQALIEKGAPIGTSLAFIMAVSGISLPEMALLRKALRPILIIIFLCSLIVGITAVGYLMNALF